MRKRKSLQVNGAPRGAERPEPVEMSKDEVAEMESTVRRL